MTKTVTEIAREWLRTEGAAYVCVQVPPDEPDEDCEACIIRGLLAIVEPATGQSCQNCARLQHDIEAGAAEIARLESIIRGKTFEPTVEAVSREETEAMRRAALEPQAEPVDGMPECICGSAPEHWRHRSDCPLRYWHECRRLQAELNRLRVNRQAEPSPSLAHLEPVQLRRIIDRHVRWHDEALRLLQQVANGYEGEWPELAKFVSDSTTRLVPSTPENR